MGNDGTFKYLVGSSRNPLTVAAEFYGIGAYLPVPLRDSDNVAGGGTAGPGAPADGGAGSGFRDLDGEGGISPGGPDDSLGGSVQAPDGSTVEEAAADSAVNKPDPEPTESMVGGGVPLLRGFTDQTFVLMHRYNLINLRNEKMPDWVDDYPIGQKHAEVVANTMRNLKSPTPFAYLSTDDNPIEHNAVIQCYGEPTTFLNYMTADPAYQNYLNASPSEISKLASKIRLYKLFHQDDKEEVVEIEFGSAGMGAAELESFVNSKGLKRGYGAGIKSFDVNFTGNNPAIAQTTVQATLVIYADSMDTLLKPRRGTGEAKDLFYRYIDIAFKAKGGRNAAAIASKGELLDMNFEIIADVGLVAGGSSRLLNTDTSSLSMKLNAVGHVFDMGQDGSVTFTVEFEGFIQHTFSDPVKYDIFATDTGVFDDFYDQLAFSLIKDTCGKEKVTEVKKRMAARANDSYKQRIFALNDMLRTSGKLFYVKISPDVLRSYNDAFNALAKDTTPETVDSKAAGTPKMSDEKIKQAFIKLQRALGHAVPEPGEDASPSGRYASSPLNVVSSGAVEKQSKQIQEDMEEEDSDDLSTIVDCGINPNSTQVIYFYAGDLINLILKNMSSIYSPTNLHTLLTAAATKVIKDLTPADNDGGSYAFANEMGVTPSLSAEIHNPDMTGQDLAGSPQAMAMKKAYLNEIRRFNKLRIVLGPTQITDFFSVSQVMCSIGDIPVALNHFNAWLVSKMEGTRKTRYSLDSFLNDFINKYLRVFLKGKGEFFDANRLGELKQFDKTEYIGYMNQKSDEADTDQLTIYRTNPDYGGRKGLVYEKIPQENRPLIRTSSNKFLLKHKKEAYDYKLFFDRHISFAIPRTPQAHIRQGINIYQHGVDRGIVKDIQYQRTDVPYRKEAVWLGSMDGLMQIAEVFNASITTYADLQTHIGQYIYIDPKSITPYLSRETQATLQGYDLSKLGIGGYFQVNKVHHSFAQGKFETKLTTSYIATANQIKTSIGQDNDYLHSEEFIRNSIQAALGIGTESEPTDNPDQSTTDKEDPCKVAEAPTTTDTTSDALDKAISVATELFGSAGEAIVGFIKGIFDNSSSEPSVENLGAAFAADFAARKSANNPDQGNSGAANNGPSSN